MKKLLIVVCAAVMTLTTACGLGDRAKSDEDSVKQAKIDSLEAALAQARADSSARRDSVRLADSLQRVQKAQINVIKNFYAKCVFGPNQTPALLSRYLTPEVMKRLRDAYEYDGGGYAVWEFRTPTQDGPKDYSSIGEIKPVTGDKPNVYDISYSDMGNPGNTRVTLSPSGPDWLISDYKYLGPEYY